VGGEKEELEATRGPVDVQEVQPSSFHQPRSQLSGFSVQLLIQHFWLSSAQVQAAICLAVPYDSAFGYADLSWIACLQLAFVLELVGWIGSSKPILLLQNDYPSWKRVPGKP
jgi:hypothetical protein